MAGDGGGWQMELLEDEHDDLQTDPGRQGVNVGVGGDVGNVNNLHAGDNHYHFYLPGASSVQGLGSLLPFARPGTADKSVSSKSGDTILPSISSSSFKEPFPDSRDSKGLNTPSGVSDGDLRIILVGRTGSGKSTTGNLLLGYDWFEVKTSAKGVTRTTQRKRAERDGRSISVVDTPGLFDAEFSNEEIMAEITKCIEKSTPGAHAFILVIPVGCFSSEQYHTVGEYLRYFGDRMTDHLIVLFSKTLDLGEQFLDEYLENVPPNLADLLRRVNDRYTGYDSRQDKEPQYRRLMSLIDGLIRQNGGSFYTKQMFQEAEEARSRRNKLYDLGKEEMKLVLKWGIFEDVLRERGDQLSCIESAPGYDLDSASYTFAERTGRSRPSIISTATGLWNKLFPVDQQLRIVLLGRAGAGKSTAGNFLLDSEEFKATTAAQSVTKATIVKRTRRSGRKILVVDTPGCFGTETEDENILAEIMRCLPLSHPGPHVFLLVFPAGRMTPSDLLTVQQFQELFGPQMTDFAIVLFSRLLELGDLPLDEYVKSLPQPFADFLHRVGNRYMGYDKVIKGDHQFNRLMEIVDGMVDKNGGQFYSSDRVNALQKKK